MNVLSTKAGKNAYKVFLSQSQDSKKNPLTYEQKIKHVRKMFPKHGRNVILNKKLRSVFEVAVSLYNQGFNKVTMVVGADRITEFETLLNKYNGTQGRHGFYNFEKISVVSAGDRDPDSEGVEGMSASKQRENASKNDFTTFSQGVPSTMSNKDAKRLFNDVRSGMGLSETTSFRNHVELEKVSDIREKYIEGDLFAEGDRVVIKSSGESGTVHRLGTNYVIVELDTDKISRQWLENVEKTDRWYREQPEWGTPESTKKAKKVTPGEVKEDEVATARRTIDREVQQDKIKFDRILDKARLARALRKNRGLPYPDVKKGTVRTRSESTNPVAKHAPKFNKAVVHTDKKKDAKKGYVKHKKDINK